MLRADKRPGKQGKRPTGRGGYNKGTWCGLRKSLPSEAVQGTIDGESRVREDAPAVAGAFIGPQNPQTN